MDHLFFFISGSQQLVLAGIVRHLDHKNIMHDPEVKSYVIRTATALARQIRSGAVLSDMGVVSDLCRHLRKSLQATAESVGERELHSNLMLQTSIEACLLEIARGVMLFNLMKICLILRLAFLIGCTNRTSYKLIKDNKIILEIMFLYCVTLVDC